MSAAAFAFPLDPAFESNVRAIGERLFALMDAQPMPGIFSKRGVTARLMEWSMKDPAFKTQLFRFVDVLPSLDSSAEIVRHLQEYLGDRAVELNPAMKVGLAASSFAPGLIAGPVKANVISMAAEFVAGESPDDLIKRLRENTACGVATTIDLLGETVVSAAEADAFLKRNIDVLNTVSNYLTKESKPGFSDQGVTGILPRLNLSVKVSALTPDIRPADPENSIAALKTRLRPILRRAGEVGALINFDMESYKLKDLTLDLFKSILEEPEFQTTPAVGIALQAYLRDSEADLQNLITWTRQRNRPVSVRLVKGAYWDYETILAQQRNWPVPVWQRKAETDANYEKLSRALLDHLDVITPNFATHNVRSVAQAIAYADQLGIDPRAYEFQALYGMADELKRALVESGYRVREYCAIGELLPGMAYLVRRLLENTSNEGFLRLKNLREASKDLLLTNPAELLTSSPASAGRKSVTAPPPNGGAPNTVYHPFQNAPNTDFSQLTARSVLRAALQQATARPPKKWPLIIGGHSIANREYVASINPAHPQDIVGYWARATIADAELAVTAALKAQLSWALRPVTERTAIIDRAADLLEAKRQEFNALEVREAAKPWIEADADVSEAIDFCRYYAQQMLELGTPRVTQVVAGERCVQRWLPRGVGVVIAPWNFPLAILCGMTVAPLVGGNAVILKPAEQTSVVAAAFMDVLIEAGVPAGVVNLLTGFGEDVGAHLVAHPKIEFVAFTGSRAVGLKIWETAARTQVGQRNLKKVVCEMGGKNALIIDNDADLDEAIPATLYSAFGFSGQKCSALSRLIVLEEVNEKFVERLIAAADAMPVGDPAEPGTVVGPVIDGPAQEKILQLIEQGKKQSRLAWQAILPSEATKTGGTYVAPTIFTDVKSDHIIAREEIFGPVLAILKVRNLDEAIEVANSTEYALTGGLFSRSPGALERAERELQCGNIYLNRGITGAIVERHPFGGFKMSGGGTKAGGPDYLENFLFPQVVAENVMRRGFTPPEAGE
ncbi:MAG: proline dehydrogenase family protein [Opitutus sp.]